MSLLRKIQQSLMEENSNLGPILLKLRFLALKLGSNLLEEWVKHENEGYPDDIEVPAYRKIPVSYKATFLGPAGFSIPNAPIPPLLIEKFCGEKWVDYEIRQSVAAVDSLLSDDKTGQLEFDASNLIMVLQGKVYEDLACSSVTGTVSRAALNEVRHKIRSKVLDLTIELEKKIPIAIDITISTAGSPEPDDTEAATQLTQNIIYGDNTNVNVSGDNNAVSITVKSGDISSLRQALISQGIPPEDAKELSEIVEAEEPESDESPLGPRAKIWLRDKLKGGAAAAWDMGKSAIPTLIIETVKKYHGI